jgi:hypothetical protein
MESSPTTRSFASLDSGSMVASGPDARVAPKISLGELVTLVRHSKYSQVKEALDYLPTKRFDPSVIEVCDCTYITKFNDPKRCIITMYDAVVIVYTGLWYYIRRFIQ